MDIAKLKQLTSKIPAGPGIYRFQNDKKEDIYIGKASSIRRRLASYSRTDDSRIKKMVASASYLNHVETESDIEALILESQLIKQQRPQFNIMLRDDKQYFYVAFSNDEFPRVSLTHQPTGDYIGPFTEGTAIKATLKYLRDIFPYCTCSQKHHNFCLNYHIGKCIGFCCLNSNPSPEQIGRYSRNIKAIKEILTGRRSFLVKELKKEMELAAKKHDFTKAIELRTKLERLERVFYNAQVIRHSEIVKSYNSGLTKLLGAQRTIARIEGYDISNIQGKHASGSMVTFVNGQPDKNFYRKFNINTVKGSNDPAMLAEILKRRLNHTEWPFPDLILVDGGKGQVSSALAALEEKGVTIPLIGISKNERHIGHQLIIPGKKQPLSLEKLSEIDKDMLLAIDAEAHRFAINHYRKRHRKSI